jgi:hypothetical protein
LAPDDGGVQLSRNYFRFRASRPITKLPREVTPIESNAKNLLSSGFFGLLIAANAFDWVSSIALKFETEC